MAYILKTGIVFSSIWFHMSICANKRNVRMRISMKKGEPGDPTSGGVARALYLDDAPRDFGPVVAFSLSSLSF